MPRKQGQYPARQCQRMTREQQKNVREIAKAAGVAAAEVTRQALDAALPQFLEVLAAGQALDQFNQDFARAQEEERARPRPQPAPAPRAGGGKKKEKIVQQGTLALLKGR